MMNKLRSILLLQTLLFSVLALTAPQVFAVAMDKNFDHYNTNFPLDGAHKRAKCDSCHKRGIFKGTPKACQSCHGANSKIASSTMPTTHVRVTGTCDTCHSEKDWGQVRMDHSAVSGTCKSCHGAVKGVTKMPLTNHPVTQSDCEVCHSDRAWLPAKFEHTAETTNCIRCHNGTTATGKHNQHIPVINNECDACHGTRFRTFKDIKRPMVHEGYVTTGDADCTKCHNGSVPKATAKPASHVTVLLNECGACHSTRNFTAIKSPMPHDGYVSTNCRTCHEGQVASADSMLNATRVRGHSHVDPGSLNDCTICHKSGFRSWDGGTNRPVPASGNAPHHGGHFVDPIGCNNAGCHQEPAFHTTSMNVADVKALCSDCHASKPAIMIHDAARDTQCKVCHANGQSGSSTNAEKVTPSHSSFMNGASNSDCELCHKRPISRKAAPGSFNQFQPTMDHGPFSPSLCGYCHTLNQEKANAPKPSIKSPTDHARITASNSCGQCHGTNSTFINNVDRADMHARTSGKQCSVCHNPTVTYPKGGRKMTNAHQNFAGTATQCKACHGRTNTYKDGFNHAVSITGTNVATCHICHQPNGSYPSTGQKRESINHDKPGQTTCLNGNCHNGTSPGGIWD